MPILHSQMTTNATANTVDHTLKADESSSLASCTAAFV